MQSPAHVLDVQAHTTRYQGPVVSETARHCLWTVQTGSMTRVSTIGMA